MEIVAVPVVLAALDREHILLDRERDVVRCKARKRQGNLVTVLAQALNVVGWIGILVGVLGSVNKIQQPVKADG